MTETKRATELLRASAAGATVSHNGQEVTVGWEDLHDAAAGRCVGIDPVEQFVEDGTTEFYRDLLRQAINRFHDLPHCDQGLVVNVLTRTGGATWVAEVYDALGQYRGDLMAASEGMDRGHLEDARREAHEIAERIGSYVRVLPID